MKNIVKIADGFSKAVLDKNNMENYKRYKENNPHKTDAQIIESLVWELKDKVETIHRLLAINQALRIHDVVGRSEQLLAFGWYIMEHSNVNDGKTAKDYLEDFLSQ